MRRRAAVEERPDSARQHRSIPTTSRANPAWSAPTATIPTTTGTGRRRAPGGPPVRLLRSDVDLVLQPLRSVGGVRRRPLHRPFDHPTANPVLLVGTRFDPASPYENAVVVDDLMPDSALLTVEGWGHTSAEIPSQVHQGCRLSIPAGGGHPTRGGHMSSRLRAVRRAVTTASAKACRYKLDHHSTYPEEPGALGDVAAGGGGWALGVGLKHSEPGAAGHTD